MLRCWVRGMTRSWTVIERGVAVVTLGLVLVIAGYTAAWLYVADLVLGEG